MADSITFAPMAPPTDPDAATTITDFVDYTEFYTSDLFRSLALIGKLDAGYHDHVSTIHDLLTKYATLPSLPQPKRQDPQSLRKDTSIELDQALRAREASYAEAVRLCNLTNNLCERLPTLRAKLEAQPKPPSREPSPTPQDKRRKVDTDRQPRIRLLTNGHGQSRSSARTPGAFPRRRIIIPGEVLPPRDPNSPGPSEFSDSETERIFTPAPSRSTVPKSIQTLIDKEKTPKLLKPPKGIKADKVDKSDPPKSQNKPKPQVNLGTNVHSTVAGISVSNAMAQLSAPPEDPPLGSKHAPWSKLTEWELHQIRKRMKKNADWMPSAIMVNRELKDKKRGEENKRKARLTAQENGELFYDEEPEDFIRRPLNARTMSAEPRLTSGEDEVVVNRGMDLNKAKKIKREQTKIVQREQAQREVEEAVASRGQGHHQASSAATEVPLSIDPHGDNPAHMQSKKSKKRKRQSSVSITDQQTELAANSTVKKIKLAPPAPNGPTDTSKEIKPVSDSLAADSGLQEGDKTSKRASRSAAANAKTAAPSELAIEIPAVATVSANQLNIRPRSRGTTSIKLNMLPSKKAASAEPERPRQPARRPSDTGLAKGKKASANTTGDYGTAASQRKSRRPAPGIILNHNPGQGAKVSIGTRKSKPKKKSDKIKTEAGEEVADDYVDPEEPRYCICNDVSHGAMIACDNPECPLEWFHVECVGLDDPETRIARVTWYCPKCRDQFGADNKGILWNKK